LLRHCDRWLLATAFATTRQRPCAYELVTDPKDRSPDILVVDAEDEDAIARWRKRDPMGAAALGRELVPAAA
jgi:hypothetical protein